MSKTNHRYVFSIMLMKCFFLNNFMFCRYRRMRRKKSE